MEKLSKMKRLVRVLDGLTAGGSSSSPKDSDVVESLSQEHFNICKVGETIAPPSFAGGCRLAHIPYVPRWYTVCVCPILCVAQSLAVEMPTDFLHRINLVEF